MHWTIVDKNSRCVEFQWISLVIDQFHDDLGISKISTVELLVVHSLERQLVLDQIQNHSRIKFSCRAIRRGLQMFCGQHAELRIILPL